MTSSSHPRPLSATVVIPPRTSSNKQRDSQSNPPPAASAAAAATAISGGGGDGVGVGATRAGAAPRKHDERWTLTGGTVNPVYHDSKSSVPRKVDGSPQWDAELTGGSLNQIAMTGAQQQQQQQQSASSYQSQSRHKHTSQPPTRGGHHYNHSANATSGHSSATAATVMPSSHQQTSYPHSASQQQKQPSQQHSRPHQSQPRRRETTFGDYALGRTLGEGEFGKVKLGWKRADNHNQVAIKLIRLETLSNPPRLPKINREISILDQLNHPNIVKLHEIVQTDKYIGIILAYASGGELFDYILRHRYLNENAAKRLFAQLVSGVGYLHKKGIVHRDLKLENLLLDRNRNIIITDFGFANTFNPNDELSHEIEYNITNKEFVKRMQLDRVDANGFKRGDLMVTSCGSPCYAAPELVVSNSLYTARKVDVWSCGVILYAMLAGYLPFDDDPANPDGDNINLLYRYIISTPLTFPEHITPGAKDLLRRMLVADPRQRADLFEVASHSWLKEYANVVSHITSNAHPAEFETAKGRPSLADRASLGSRFARSASVQVPKPIQHPAVPVVGGLSHPPGSISPDGYRKTHGRSDERASSSGGPRHLDAPSSSVPSKHRDGHRRTLQVEYVPPTSQTSRGGNTAGSSKGTKPSSTTSQQPDTRFAAPVSVYSQRQPPENAASSYLSSYNNATPTPSKPPTKVTATGDYSDSKESKRISASDLNRPVSGFTHAFGKKSSKHNTDRADDSGPTRTRGTADTGFRKEYTNREHQSVVPPDITPGRDTGYDLYDPSAYDLNHTQRPVELTGGYGSLYPPEHALHQPLGSLSTAVGTKDDKQNRPTSAIRPAEPTNNSDSINEHNNPNNGSDSNKGHQRSSTMTSLAERIFGRSAGKGMAMLGIQSQSRSEPQVQLPGSEPSTSQTQALSAQRREEKRKKRYPPTSMREPFSPVSADQQSSHGSVTSSSRRSISQAYNQWRSRKDSSASQSQNRPGNQEAGQEKGHDGSSTAGSSKRFSFLPPSLVRTFGGSSSKVHQTDNASTAPGSTVSQSAVYSTDKVDQLPPSSQPQSAPQESASSNTKGGQQHQKSSSITSTSPLATSGEAINQSSIDAQMHRINTFVRDHEQAMKAMEVDDDRSVRQASAGQQSSEPMNSSMSDRIEQQFKELHAHEQHRFARQDETGDGDDHDDGSNQHLVPGPAGGSKGSNSDASSAIRLRGPSEIQATKPNYPTVGSPLPSRSIDRHPEQTQGKEQGQGEIRFGLQGHRKKFTDIYEKERVSSGSSGAARRVMEFFRRRARTRAGDS